MNTESTPEAAADRPKKKRRFLSPEKKFQIYLEAQGNTQPIGEILRREGLFSTDLARIRLQVKEGALTRLGAKSGAKPAPSIRRPTMRSNSNSKIRNAPWLTSPWNCPFSKKK